MVTISETQFAELAQYKLGEAWGRGLAVFRNYGFHLASEVALVLLYAVGQNKTNEALVVLEEHYDNHLKNVDPEIRRMARDGLVCLYETRSMFIRIYGQVLGLETPNLAV